MKKCATKIGKGVGILLLAAFCTAAWHTTTFAEEKEWGPKAKLTAEDKAEEDQFGTDVAIEGTTAVIGMFKERASYWKCVYIQKGRKYMVATSKTHCE